MARGRKPTPTALKVLRGNPGKRPLSSDEPQPPAAPLISPAWLSDHAREHWEQTAPILAAHGLLTVLDVPAWSLACAAWSQVQAMSRLVEQDGATMPTAREGAKSHPAARLMQIWADLYLKLAREFGMTPTARVHLHVARPDPDELDRFLQGKPGRAKTPTKDKSRFFRRPD
jgi:P27 family predicted phage terminase small subunit